MDEIYNPFINSDIDEIDNVIKYARGLIIKDQNLAEMYETDESLRMSDRYIRAVEDTLRNVTDYEKRLVISDYSEKNPYYKALSLRYGIDPYTARKARDYEILKVSNNTLSNKERSIFEKAYYESVKYFTNVTYTDAFNNQKYYREFFSIYIIFSTILRYVNAQMVGYFDVDTYNKSMLKNGFISNGLDYFDEIPLVYQRKIYKAIDDLIRNKGTDNVFGLIRDIFSFNSINVHKYVLTKNRDNLTFYKVPLDEHLNPSTHQSLAYEDVVGNDPYWRAEKEDILTQSFNKLDTKYISADIDLDLVNNSKKMSYFFSMLNYASIKNIASKNINNVSLLNDSFSFINRTISEESINIFDAIVCLMVLMYNKLEWKDTIHRVNFSKGIYAYNLDIDQESIQESVKSVRSYLYYNRELFESHDWDDIMSFFVGFKLHDFDYGGQIALDDIMSKYNESLVYENQLLFLSDYIYSITKNKTLEGLITDSRTYDSLEYVTNILTDSNSNIDMSLIYKYHDLSELLSLFVRYQHSLGYMDTNKLVLLMNNNLTLKGEISRFAYSVSSPSLTRVMNSYFAEPITANGEQLLSEIDAVVVELLSDSKYTGSSRIEYYPNLYVYLNVILSYKRDSSTSKMFSIEEFMSMFNHNESLRLKLENLIETTSDPVLHSNLQQLWDSSFNSDFNMQLFKGNTTFSDYLMKENPSLYNYTKIINPNDYDFEFDNSSIYRDKIFELLNSIGNYINVDFISQNNFIGMSEYIRRYMYILITVFKSYTSETLYTNNLFDLNDKLDNGIRVMDSVKIGNTNLTANEFIDLQDITVINSNLGYEGTVEFKETISMSITEDGNTRLVGYTDNQ